MGAAASHTQLALLAAFFTKDSLPWAQMQELHKPHLCHTFGGTGHLLNLHKPRVSGYMLVAEGLFSEGGDGYLECSWNLLRSLESNPIPVPLQWGEGGRGTSPDPHSQVLALTPHLHEPCL